MTWKVHDAVASARQLLKGRKGPPTDEDGPRRGARGPRPLDGQIDIYGIEFRRFPQLKETEEAERDE
jgi:hypothetical protein